MNKISQIAGIVLVCSSLFVAGNSFASGPGWTGGPGGFKPGPVLKVLLRVDHILDKAIAKQFNRLQGQGAAFHSPAAGGPTQGFGG